MQHAHTPPAENKSYNERLFKGGIRKYFHEARFIWLQKALKKMDIKNGSVLELGCYDGKMLSYLPFEPVHYSGYDANWENGLELAKERWGQHSSYAFYYCNDIKSFNPSATVHDITVCMETLEHLPLADLEAYLLKIRESTGKYVFITVPNEKGPLVMLKYAIKKWFLAVDEPYRFKELMYASVGKLSRVERKEFGHKGFDHEQLSATLAKYFRIISIEPLPFSLLPAWMNFSIGIIAAPK